MIDMKNKFLKFTLCFLLAVSFIQSINISYSYAKEQSVDITSPTKEEKTQQLNLIKDDNKNDREVIVTSNLKKQLIDELKKRHAKGEYLEITENMIKALTDSELQALLFNEVQIIPSMKFGADTMESITKKSEEVNENFSKDDLDEAIAESYKNYTYVDFNFNDLYSLPEETQNSVFELIKDYTREKKEAMALLALCGIGGIGLLKKGQELLKSESVEDRIQRHIKLKEIKEKELLETMRMTDYKDGIYYKFYDDDDNLKNLTERSINSGMTLKQESRIANEVNRITSNSAKVYDAMETLAKKASEVETNEKGKEMIDNLITQIQENKDKEIKLVQSSKNMKERLQEMNDTVYDDMHMNDDMNDDI